MARRITLLVVVLLVWGTTQAEAATLPAGFEERNVVSGLTGPVGVAWTPDGRMIVIEKYGRFKVFQPGATTPAVNIDLSKKVNSYWDHGLHGLAIDPNFATNHYVYLLYVAELYPLIPDSSSPTVSKLARYQLSDTNQLTNETIILGKQNSPCPAVPSQTTDCIPADAPSHMIGTVRAAPDGTLYVGSGDASSFGALDNRAFRALNESSMAGKIMHIDRNGNGLPGHGFCPTDTDLTHVCTKLFAKGFRNPFRFMLNPSGGLIVGDVGWNTREEVDVIPSGGHSYGWPCYEGSMRTPQYSELAACAPEYAKEGTPDAAVPPAYDYLHDVSNAVIGGPLYQGSGFPSTYQDRLFFGDYAAGWLKTARIGSDGKLTDIQDFGTGWYGTDLDTTPGGELIYTDFGDGSAGTGAIKKIVYSAGNASPVAHAGSNVTTGPPPLAVNFSSAGSSDPDGDTLSYSWDFGDGTANSTAGNPAHTYSAAGVYSATLTVSDGHGLSDTDTVQIVVGGSPPNATITAPVDESLYRDGGTITFRGSATDAEDGAIPASNLQWDVVIHHSTHIHHVGTFDGVSQGSFTTLRDHDSDSYYEITLRATDSSGLTNIKQVQIRPETAPFKLRSEPSGAPVSYYGIDTVTPFDRDAAIGLRTTISAGNTMTSDGVPYVFDSWSDGGARIHDVDIPPTATTLTASYLEDKASGRTATASSTASGHTPGQAVDGNAATSWISGAADSQWWQVDLGSARQVSGVQVDWDAAYASSYEILTSVDAVNFVPADQTGAVGPGVQTDRFTSRAARYVRIHALPGVAPGGISFKEARVFGPSDTVPTYAQTMAATPGLVNWWRLDDTGSTAADSKGSGNGTYVGGPSPFASILSQDTGSSRAFDGVDDMVDLPPAAFGTPAQFSVETWVRLDKKKVLPTAAQHFLVADTLDQSLDGFALYTDNLNLPKFSVVKKAGTGMTVTAPTALAVGGTYHLVATYDGSFVRLYVNGVEKTKSGYTGGIGYDPGRVLYLGSQPKSYQRSIRWLDGKLDEVALYNEALPTATVQQHYLRGR
jgi:glucose/arabinose dehydrogenase